MFDSTAIRPPNRAALVAARSVFQGLMEQALVSRRSRYIYFYTPKCACTTLKALLWRAEAMAGGTRRVLVDYDDIHVHQRCAYSPWWTEEGDVAAAMSEKDTAAPWFTFVRNPYVRFHSAYQWLFGSDANTETRAAYSARLGWACPSPPSLPTFVELVAQQSAQEMDRHWAPLTSFIPMDELRLDFIGAVETFEDDARNILRRIFGTDEAFDPSMHLYRSSREPWLEAMRQLPAASIDLLHRVYRRDCELLGYSQDPCVLAPDREKLRALAAPHALSPLARSCALEVSDCLDGPSPMDMNEIRVRLPQADLADLDGLALCSAPMPDWWARGGNRLWIRPGVAIPDIENHPNAPPPSDAIVIIASDAAPKRLLIWGEGATVVLGVGSLLSDVFIACGTGSAIFIGKDVKCQKAQVDARNGGVICVTGDGLWFPGVRLLTDGMHAVRDRATGSRLNPFGGRIEIDSHVWLGRGATVFGDCRIGEGSIVDDGVVVRSDLPPYAFCAGAPAQVTRHNIIWTWEDSP